MIEGFSFEMKELSSMSRGWRALLVTSVLAVLTAGPALAQIAPMGTVPRTVKPSKPVPAPIRKAPVTITRTAPDALAPSNPDFKPEVVVTQTPTPLSVAPAVWDVPDAEALLNYIGGVAKEGLEPADYDPAGPQGA